MTVLYVAEQGAQLRKERGRFLVVREGDLISSLPAAQVDEVVILGNVGLTTPVIGELLRSGKDCVFCSQSGEYKGRLISVESRYGMLRRRQLELATDPGRRLELAKEMVRAKLHNQRALIQRWGRARPSSEHVRAAGAIETALERLPGAKAPERLRAIEGYATFHYFRGFAATLKGWQFAGRNRRPPRDPVNSLLSLGYTILARRMENMVRRVGLDPFLGVYHAVEYSRPALALDIAEEFRHVIVDSVVLRALNVGSVKETDFHRDEDSGGIRLTKTALPIFIEALEERLATEIAHPWARQRASYERCLEIQAREVARVILGKRSSYRGFVVR